MASRVSIVDNPGRRNAKGRSSMAQVLVDRHSHVTLLEESWWNAVLGGQEVAVHARLYRCDGGENRGKFSASAHLHSKSGGHHLLSSRPPDSEKFIWNDTRESAVEA